MVQGPTYSNDIPDRVVRTIMNKADLDDSGYLEFPEFIAMIDRKENMHGVFGDFIQRYVRKLVPYQPDRLHDEEYNCRPPAIVMIIISIIQIILFLYDRAVPTEDRDYGPAATIFVYNPSKRYEVWRYLTYMFVHYGVSHLLVNLLVQVMLGIPLEMVHKWWRVLAIYLAGVVAGSLGTSVAEPDVFMGGASGGVYALITAHVATILMNWSQMEYAVLQLCVFLVITSVDVGQTVYNRYVGRTEDQIGYTGHLAGAIAGLLVGIKVLRNLEVQTWEKYVWWASVLTYIALMTGAIIWNVFGGRTFQRRRKKSSPNLV